MEGCAPKCNSTPAPFIEGREPNCPEFPKSTWRRNINGYWYNGEICTEVETDEEEVEIDLIEIGNAEPSEEEDNRAQIPQS